MQIRKKIRQAIKKVVGDEQFAVEACERMGYGDYSTNAAMVLAKKEKKNPQDLAEEIVSKLQEDKKLKGVVSKIKAVKPGFINFHISNDVLLNVMMQIDKVKGKYWFSDIGREKNVIVEYSSPNIAKPFTIGHLRSTIIGDSIANLLEAVGYKVYRDNHLGDWGTQFGKQIYAVKKWGNIKEIEKSDNPIKDMVSLYVKFHKEVEKNPAIEEKGREWFKKLEDGDEEARDLWRKCVDWSWKEFDRIYKVLGIKFSDEFEGGRGLGESFFEDKMRDVIDELNKKELLKEGEGGAKLVFFENDKYPPAMILKKDGATLYHTRDLATDKYRLKNYGDDVIIINEVGSEQNLYFRQLFEMEKMLGWTKENQRVHVGHGLIRFKSKKMSTRKGDVVWLEDVLKNAGEKALERMDAAVKHSKGSGLNEAKLSMDVGVGAIKYNDLKRDPKTNIVFDWDEMLNMQGNSGPYLQYTFARTQSVIGNSKLKSQRSKVDDVKFNKEEELLLRTFIKFPEVVQESAERYAPNLLCNYLFGLAQSYNNFYNKHKIIESDNENFRLMLTKATGQILENGLSLLGIKAPEKM